MPDRTAKFVLTIFAGLLAGVPLTTISNGAAGADDECLSSPKDQTPVGSHWFYRIDRATKRQCWYLKDAGEQVSQTASPGSAAKPVLPKPAEAAQRLIVDARAELPAQTRSEQPNRTRSVSAISADAAISENSRDTKPPVAATQPPMLASRWLGQTDADSPAASSAFLTSPKPLAGPMPNGSAASGTMANSPMPNSPMPSRDTADTNVGAIPNGSLAPLSQQLSPVAAGQFAAPDLPPGTPTHSVQMLLAAMMGALGLAGLMGRAIFKFVGPRSPAKRKGRKRRGANWKSTDTARRKSKASPRADALQPRPNFPRDLDQDKDPDGRIAEFFTKMSHHAPT